MKIFSNFFALSMLVHSISMILMKFKDGTADIFIRTQTGHQHDNEYYLLDCKEEHGYSE